MKGRGIHWPAMGWRSLAAICTISVVFTVASSAVADIYRCKRADGSLHYTNTRSSGKSCRVVVRGSKKSKARRSRPAKARRRAVDPLRHTRYDGLIEEAASLYQLPQEFIRAVMRVESNFNPDVVSRAGAMGLMQLMPKTALSMGVADPFEPRQNILGGARYLRILANRFKGDLILTVAAYNAGEGAVERYNGIPPYQETQRYVRRVLKHYYSYRDRTGP